MVLRPKHYVLVGSLSVCAVALLTGASARSSVVDDELVDLTRDLLERRSDAVENCWVDLDCMIYVPASTVDPSGSFEDEVLLKHERWSVLFRSDQFQMRKLIVKAASAASATTGDSVVRTWNGQEARSVSQHVLRGEDTVSAAIFDSPPDNWFQHPISDFVGYHLAYFPWYTPFKYLDQLASSQDVSSDGSSITVRFDGILDAVSYKCIISDRADDSTLDGFVVEYYRTDGSTLSTIRSTKFVTLTGEEVADNGSIHRQRFNEDGSLRSWMKYEISNVRLRSLTSEELTDPGLFRVEVPDSARVGDQRYRAAYRVGDTLLNLDGAFYETHIPLTADTSDRMAWFVANATKVDRSLAAAPEFGLDRWGSIGLAAGGVAVLAVGVRCRRKWSKLRGN